MNCRRGLILLVFILFISISNQSFAQCCEPDPNSPAFDPGCNPDLPVCPIDGGLSLLIAAGIGLGARRAYKLKKIGTVCNF